MICFTILRSIRLQELALCTSISGVLIPSSVIGFEAHGLISHTMILWMGEGAVHFGCIKDWSYVERQVISQYYKSSCLGVQNENILKLLRNYFFRFSCLPFKHSTDTGSVLSEIQSTRNGISTCTQGTLCVVSLLGQDLLPEKENNGTHS
jgi:hypothetical protein